MKLRFVYEDNLELCKELLINNGYKVLDPINVYPVNSINDLISLFYTILYEVNPKAREVYRNEKIDRRLMSEFVKSRMKEHCINKQRAIQECAEIIIYLFKFIRNGKLKLKYPVQSTRILGRAKMRWVTDKVEYLMLMEKWIEKTSKANEFVRAVEDVDHELDEEQYDRETFLEKVLKRITNG